MQAKNHDGSYGEILPYTGEGLDELMKRADIQHVEVFEGTEENIKARQKLLGVKKRYQKAPKNNK